MIRLAALTLLLLAPDGFGAVVVVRDNLDAVASTGANIAFDTAGVVLDSPVPLVVDELSVVVAAWLADGSGFPADQAEQFGFPLALEHGGESQRLTYTSSLFAAESLTQIQLDAKPAIVIPAGTTTINLRQLPDAGELRGRVFHLATTLFGSDTFQSAALTPLVTGGQWAVRLVGRDGDLNDDRSIDGRDFLAWQRSPIDPPFAVWAGGYGHLFHPTATPEPTALVMALQILATRVRWH